MADRGYRRRIVIVGLVLFAVGFAYGAYRSISLDWKGGHASLPEQSGASGRTEFPRQQALPQGSADNNLVVPGPGVGGTDSLTPGDDLLSSQEGSGGQAAPGWDSAQPGGSIGSSSPGLLAGGERLVLRTITPETGAIEEKETVVPEYMRGDRLEELTALYPGYSVEKQSDDLIILARTLPAPESDESYYFGVYGGRVAVYVGEPRNGVVYYLTGTRVSNLPPLEAERLEKGIQVVGKEAMLNMLESYNE